MLWSEFARQEHSQNFSISSRNQKLLRPKENDYISQNIFKTYTSRTSFSSGQASHPKNQTPVRPHISTTAPHNK